MTGEALFFFPLFRGVLRVTSAKVRRPGLLLGMSEPPSKYCTLATSTESSLHF